MTLSPPTSFRAYAVVGAIALLFALQLVYVTVADEPYPAVMMPRFSWAGPPQSTLIAIQVPEVVMHYADSTTKPLAQRELLAGIPTGRHSTIMGNILSPISSDPPARAPGGKYTPPAWLFPGYGIAKITRQTAAHRALLAEWLRERARAVYSGAPPTRCVVNWFTDSFPYETRSGGEPSRVSHVLSGTFEVDLHAAATSLH